MAKRLDDIESDPTGYDIMDLEALLVDCGFHRNPNELQVRQYVDGTGRHIFTFLLNGRTLPVSKVIATVQRLRTLI